MKKKVWYVEPADYIPEELRKKYKLGEFAEEKAEGIENVQKPLESEDKKNDKIVSTELLIFNK